MTAGWVIFMSGFILGATVSLSVLGIYAFNIIEDLRYKNMILKVDLLREKRRYE